MALFAIHGDHRIKAAPPLNPSFAGILNGLVEMFIPVQQQVSCNMRIGGAEIKGKDKCFCVPVGAASVFFTGESLGSDVQPGIFAGVSLVKLEDIEPDSLLCGYVAL